MTKNINNICFQDQTSGLNIQNRLKILFNNLKNYIIYCDPPYQDSEQRYYDLDGNKRSFDSKAFWNWCRKMSANNIVIVSEYKAPSDFKKIYEKTKVILGTGNNDVRSVRTERLFMYKNLSK